MPEASNSVLMAFVRDLVNNTLNASTALAKVFGNSVLGGIISQVRSDLGRDIDFAKQGDRQAIGRALTKYVRDNN